MNTLNSPENFSGFYKVKAVKANMNDIALKSPFF